VAERPTRWHPLASTLKQRIEERLREVERWRQAAERTEKRPSRQQRWTPNFDNVEWGRYVREGQLLTHAPLRVTPETCERALRITNALCLAAEARGFSVSLTEDSSRIRLAGHCVKLLLRITERLDEKIVREPAYTGGPIENRKIRVPTGTLRLFVDADFALEREIAADDSKGRLEDKLNAIFMRVNRIVVRTWEKEREREDFDRKFKANAARQTAIARRKAIARKRRAELHREVCRWRRAEDIRHYIAHVVASHAIEPTDDRAIRRLRLWQTWATSLASRLDPDSHTTGAASLKASRAAAAGILSVALLPFGNHPRRARACARRTELPPRRPQVP
jgi:hypothetical protein